MQVPSLAESSVLFRYWVERYSDTVDIIPISSLKESTRLLMAMAELEGCL